MNRRVVAISIIACLCGAGIGLLTMYFMSNSQRQVAAQHERWSTANKYFEHSPAVQAEVQGHKLINDRMLQERELCDSLHLGSKERSKRIDAVYQAGMAEMKRVRKSHYQTPFNPNF